MAAVHSFRLGNKDQELGDILNSMSGREKGHFIRKALYFYIKYEHRIKQLDEIHAGVREILKRLDGISVGQSTTTKKETNIIDGIDEVEEVLKESIVELLYL